VKERDDLMSATRHAIMMLRHARSDDFTRSFNCDIVLRRHVRAKPRSSCNHGRPILCQPRLPADRCPSTASRVGAGLVRFKPTFLLRTCSVSAKISSDDARPLRNRTARQSQMRSQKVATVRHCRRGPACAYPAIRDGWPTGADTPPHRAGGRARMGVGQIVTRR
jgi:hypothetical protein